MTGWEDVIDSLAIHRVAPGAAPDLSALSGPADTEGHSFVSRTATEWADGTNRFERSGEGLFLAHLGTEPVGMCGLNVDPFLSETRVGRLRHLYVAPSARRRGIGERLVAACLDLAIVSFDRVRLRTFDPTAAAFYVAAGFVAVTEAQATHSITVESP